MQNFLASRPSVTKSLSAHRAPANAFTALAGPAPETPAHDAAPARVEVIRENGSPQRIVVTCSCGERIEVECLY